jgi:hypothetical protein
MSIAAKFGSGLDIGTEIRALAFADRIGRLFDREHLVQVVVPANDLDHRTRWHSSRDQKGHIHVT